MNLVSIAPFSLFSTVPAYVTPCGVFRSSIVTLTLNTSSPFLTFS